MAETGGEAPAPKAEKTAATGSGFVVQAAVANTRLEALSAFADMQQRYGSLLASSQPDIQPIRGPIARDTQENVVPQSGSARFM